MNETRLTFFDPTNISLPFVVYDTLISDAYHFDFIKNKKANISGFLNHLIPRLAEHRDDLHNSLLKKHNGNEELVRIIEESIYTLYFNKDDYCDDSVITIPLRINKKNYSDFLIIHDSKLQKYNMDFTNFIRSLLIEYTSKRIVQREYFFFYREMAIIKTAIENREECRFYTTNGIFSFVPVAVESSPISEFNLIAGITKDKKEICIIELFSLQEVFSKSTSIDVSQNDCTLILEKLENYYEGERKCLD